MRASQTVTLRPIEDAVEALVNHARLRSGALQDDIAIVIIEVDLTLRDRNIFL